MLPSLVDFGRQLSHISEGMRLISLMRVYSTSFKSPLLALVEERDVRSTSSKER